MYFSDLKDDAFEKESSRLHITARLLQRGKDNSRLKYSEYGLCANCVNFSITRSEFKLIRAVCSAFGDQNLTLLDTRTPVTECSDHSRRGQMSLYDMQQTAILINPKRLGPIGF